MPVSKKWPLTCEFCVRFRSRQVGSERCRRPSTTGPSLFCGNVRALRRERERDVRRAAATGTATDVLRAAGAAVGGVAVPAGLSGPPGDRSWVPRIPNSDEKYRALDDKIQAAMAAYAIPGVAVGVLDRGAEYVRDSA